MGHWPERVEELARPWRLFYYAIADAFMLEQATANSPSKSNLAFTRGGSSRNMKVSDLKRELAQ
jgi:hypothetical protein